MTNAKYTPRHRKARRPMAPIADLAETMTSMNLTPIRGTAVVSATGLALTAVVTPVVNASPSVSAHTEEAALTTTAQVEALTTTVSVPDIAWTAIDELSVVAEAPAAEEVAPEPAEEVQEDAAASRDNVREDIASDQSVAAYTAAANAAGGDIVSIASSLLGIPYVYGGSTPAGFDCSGFTQYVYGMAGISIPRTSGAQGYAGTFVSAADAQPGDLVWHAYGHVGIYAGNGMVIEATTPGDVTQIQPLWGDYQFVRY
ncbi:C40 family peptidase [Schaalia sp. Marseille-Q2122]|uniref:C40 family peptidase n=1 Tax=Schaalia sp. Marseille-Q2122 TaxID=2736604 RepID=UPI0020CA69CC|nr:C40 family peptidase [Schaalia sp. Marseille-Q2122]